MLVVTLVATLAAASLWQQWRAVEVEAAERARIQAGWVLIGALDWSRLILREDARSGRSVNNNADHLAEPWAVPLEEARLSSFLAADKNVASDELDGLPDAFLSGRITDAQAKLNVTNLIMNGKPDPASVAAFTKLFELLGLPTQEVLLMTTQLQRALPRIPAARGAGGTGAPTVGAGAGDAGTPPSGSGDGGTDDDSSATAALLPQRTAQLVWLGLSPSTVATLEPYVTILPERTPLNINTASAEALYASVPSLDLASAKRLVAQRAHGHFGNLGDAAKQIPESQAKFNEVQHSVSTNYFEVQGRLRLDRTWVEEQSLLRRDEANLRLVWRERGAGTIAGTPGT